VGGQASGKRWQIASTWPTSNIPGQISGLPKIRTSFPYKNTVPKLGTSYLQREVWEVTEMRKLSYRKFGKMLSSSSSSQCGRTASVETYWNILKLPKQFYSEEMMCLLAGSPGSLDWQKDHSLNQYESIQLAHSSSTSPQKKPWISINIHQSWMLMFHLCPLQSPHVAWAISGTKGSLGLGSVNKDEIDSRTFEIVSAGLHWSWTHWSRKTDLDIAGWPQKNTMTVSIF